MRPLVSILIPSFNAEKWVAEAIKSAMAQTWQAKEIIIVDDGSTDRTVEIARQFASRHVCVVTQEHQGANAARNHALSVSQGDYIQWLDADDLMSADKIEKQVAAAERAGTRTLYLSGWGYFAYRTERAKFFPTSLWCDLPPLEWVLRKLTENLHMQTATWLVSRELTEAAGPWDNRLRNDGDGEYFCRVVLASDGVRFVPAGRVFYRMTPSTRLSYIGRSDEKKDSLLLSMRLHLQYLQAFEDSDRVRAACLTYLQNWFINFYPERPDIVAELQQLAKSLGGRLEVPRLRWKYAWIKPLFGWGPAKSAQRVLPRLKSELMISWDLAMYRLEKWKSQLEEPNRAGSRGHQPDPLTGAERGLGAHKSSEERAA
jgi:glycosyltransferase involved in cell wall biosynthesis